MNQKLEYISGTYKCGHSWTTVIIAATAHERKVIRDNYKKNVCPKCKDKLSQDNNTI